MYSPFWGGFPGYGMGWGGFYGRRGCFGGYCNPFMPYRRFWW